MRTPKRRTLRIAIAFALAASAIGCDSVLTGAGQTFALDGHIDDGDASTNGQGYYSSTGQAERRLDGDAEARSVAESHRFLYGKVDAERVPNSVGPFTGAPTGTANTKARSTFALDAPTTVLIELAPDLIAAIVGTGEVTFTVAVWILDGTGPMARAVPGSVVTARYALREDPNDPAKLILTGSRSDGTAVSAGIADHDTWTDDGFRPPALRLAAATYAAQAELSVHAGSDSEEMTIAGALMFDIVKR